jgi:hypothetical protein
MADMSDIQTVWVFNGARAQFPSAVFTIRELAEKWIRDNKLTGILTRYPLDQSVYEWALARQYFEPRKEEHTSSTFIGRFTTASQEHYHYEDGELG